MAQTVADVLVGVLDETPDQLLAHQCLVQGIETCTPPGPPENAPSGHAGSGSVPLGRTG